MKLSTIRSKSAEIPKVQKFLNCGGFRYVIVARTLGTTCSAAAEQRGWVKPTVAAVKQSVYNPIRGWMWESAPIQLRDHAWSADSYKKH